MRKIFIADAHLKCENDENYRLLLDFLDEKGSSADTLFILGDLFEFWIGYPKVPFRHYLPVLDALARLHAKGVEIVYFEGNHDFHMGPFFEKTLGARIFTGPAAFYLDGKKAYLSHGDQINSADYGHRLFRFLLHNRLTRAIIPLVPPAAASYIAERMARESRGNHQARQARWDYAEIARDFAAARFKEGYHAVVIGHYHLPLCETTAMDGERTLLSLGDWMTHYTYGVWEDGVFSLKAYRKT
ncbi:MAG TPA: UDP-2,3-diacylglucosamine diphosphatase [Geobacteraceae bacterium]|nr:UDP-2,3-diacylglucosamine diphosphatase [Geobacteraceae bacterium]